MVVFLCLCLLSTGSVQLLVTGINLDLKMLNINPIWLKNNHFLTQSLKKCPLHLNQDYSCKTFFPLQIHQEVFLPEIKKRRQRVKAPQLQQL